VSFRVYTLDATSGHYDNGRPAGIVKWKEGEAGSGGGGGGGVMIEGAMHADWLPHGGQMYYFKVEAVAEGYTASSMSPVSEPVWIPEDPEEAQTLLSHAKDAKDAVLGHVDQLTSSSEGRIALFLAYLGLPVIGVVCYVYREQIQGRWGTLFAAHERLRHARIPQSTSRRDEWNEGRFGANRGGREAAQQQQQPPLGEGAPELPEEEEGYDSDEELLRLERQIQGAGL